jgi:tRNA modification GTPase
MQQHFTDWEDTIVALATAQGMGAIGVIRLSGTKAISIANALFTKKDLQAQATHTLHVGILQLNNDLLDEVVIALYKNPKSFTGEDVVEINCHGSMYVQQQIIAACIKLGARAAKPGEFTLRAFLNKKLDLTQAEAVADIIAANSEKSQQIALHQLRGGFTNKLTTLRHELINFAALLELELDFAEEDVEFADRTKFMQTINQMIAEVEPLLESFKLGNAIKNGIPVAIVGKPNAGKSTLLNLLLNEERAIVSEIAGTTRDTIEDVVLLNGVQFRFIDTAGLRETTDTIEAIGVERAKQKISEADIVLLIADITEPTKAIAEQYKNLQLPNGKEVIIVLNKLDILKGNDLDNARKVVEEVTGVSTIGISAKTDIHIKQLQNLIVEKSHIGTIGKEDTIITNARHYNELAETLVTLQQIKQGFITNLSSDLIAVDVRKALHHIAILTGNVEQDKDILGTIFGKFCIGK